MRADEGKWGLDSLVQLENASVELEIAAARSSEAMTPLETRPVSRCIENEKQPKAHDAWGGGKLRVAVRVEVAYSSNRTLFARHYVCRRPRWSSGLTLWQLLIFLTLIPSVLSPCRECGAKRVNLVTFAGSSAPECMLVLVGTFSSATVASRKRKSVSQQKVSSKKPR